jgi:hypothetical protein
MGVATFVLDSFSGRGIVNTNNDQSQLPRARDSVQPPPDRPGENHAHGTIARGAKCALREPEAIPSVACVTWDAVRSLRRVLS